MRRVKVTDMQVPNAHCTIMTLVHHMRVGKHIKYVYNLRAVMWVLQH